MTPSGERAVDRDAHVLGRLLQQRLGRQHVLDLGGADAEGERAEGAVRRGVAVAADDGHAGQGEALLRADDVDDALARVVHRRSSGMPKSRDVRLQRLDLQARSPASSMPARAVARSARCGRRRRASASGRRTVRPVSAQALEGLRAGHLVDEVQVDVEEAGAVRLAVDHVGVPDLVEQRARRHRRTSVQWPSSFDRLRIRNGGVSALDAPHAEPVEA